MQQGFPWIAQQNWEDILFIHTPVPASVLQEYVPAPFTIDTYNGQGWLTLVLFRATNSRFRYFPSFLSYPKLNQMNLRTYVTFGGESGVYFFSIHINSLVAALGGNFTALPFQLAPLFIQEKNNTVLIQGTSIICREAGASSAFLSTGCSLFSAGKRFIVLFFNRTISHLYKTEKSD